MKSHLFASALFMCDATMYPRSHRVDLTGKDSPSPVAIFCRGILPAIESRCCFEAFIRESIHVVDINGHGIAGMMQVALWTRKCFLKKCSSATPNLERFYHEMATQ